MAYLHIHTIRIVGILGTCLFIHTDLSIHFHWSNRYKVIISAVNTVSMLRAEKPMGINMK